jgi:hypothetical protein
VYNPIKHTTEDWRLPPREVKAKKTAKNNADDVEVECIELGIKPGDLTTDTSEPAVDDRFSPPLFFGEVAGSLRAHALEALKCLLMNGKNMMLISACMCSRKYAWYAALP